MRLSNWSAPVHITHVLLSFVTGSMSVNSVEYKILSVTYTLQKLATTQFNYLHCFIPTHSTRSSSDLTLLHCAPHHRLHRSLLFTFVLALSPGSTTVTPCWPDCRIRQSLHYNGSWTLLPGWCVRSRVRSTDESALVASPDTHRVQTRVQGSHTSVRRPCSDTLHQSLISHQWPLSLAVSQWTCFHCCHSSCVKQFPGRHSELSYTLLKFRKKLKTFMFHKHVA